VTLLLSSGPLTADGAVGADTAAWFTTADAATEQG
jgi:hypothetical protein